MKHHFNMQSRSVPPQLCPDAKDARYCLISVHSVQCTQMVTGDADRNLSPNITLFNFYEIKCEVLTRVTVSRRRVNRSSI